MSSRRTMRTVARAVLAVGALAISLAPADAQTVPPLPPETEPVLALVAPVAHPVCGTALVVVTVAPSLAPQAPNLVELTGPFVTVCGAVPAPNGRYTCALDDEALALLNQGTGGSAAAVAQLVQLRLFGMALDQVVTIESGLPVALPPLGLAEALATTLDCAQAVAPPEPQLPAAPANDGAQPPTAPPVMGPSLRPGSIGLVPRTSIVAAPPTPAPRANTDDQASLAPVAYRTGGFLYPIVMVLPLVILAIGGYLSWALSRPALRRST